MTLIQAIIIALIEGLTEFLPVSSTGHMIIGQALMGVKSDAFVKLFTVGIQFGAILSVVVLYFKRFFRSIDFYLKLFVAFLPAAVLGLLLGDLIDAALESVATVAITLLLGGIVLLYIDRLFPQANEDDGSDRPISWLQAGLIGLFQAIAMIPGVSRSAASIIGGLSQGLSRRQAAEFSFFLAVPTMFAATAKKLLDIYQERGTLFEEGELSVFVIGNVVAFVVAMLAIRFFIGYLTKHGFRLFGWYRIVVGGALLVLLAMGVDLQIV